jgi:hypothetical protein
LPAVFFVSDRGERGGCALGAAQQWEIVWTKQEILSTPAQARCDISNAITAVLPSRYGLPTQGEQFTVEHVERAIASGLDLVVGTPASMALVFDGGLGTVALDIIRRLTDAKQGSIKDEHDKISAAAMAKMVCDQIVLAVTAQVRPCDHLHLLNLV